MRDDPHGVALIADARQELLDRVLPELTGQARYSALLVVHALGIAERELTAGDEPLEEMRALFSDLLGSQGSLEVLTAELAAAIRAGKYLARPDCHAVLRRVVLLRLAESNPKELPPA